MAVLSLALGIGANTAIFTLINDLLFKSLPVRAPEQLVSFGKADGGGILGGLDLRILRHVLLDFYQPGERASARRKHANSRGVCAFGAFPCGSVCGSGSNGSGPATQALSHLVSGTFFSVLGADPFLGRTIVPQDTELRPQSCRGDQSSVLAAGSCRGSRCDRAGQLPSTAPFSL